jgi:hypothetical protein
MNLGGLHMACGGLAALIFNSKHFPVHRNQSWLRSENRTDNRSSAISYMFY